MLRKSTAFVPRYQKFESIPLQRRESANHRFLSGGMAGMNPDLTDA